MADWKPYTHDLGREIVAGLYFCDEAAIETEAIDASSEPSRPPSHSLIKEIPYLTHHSIADVWRKPLERDAYGMEHARVWNGTGDIDDEADEPEEYTDAPVSLQLVGRRYEEKKIMEALELIKERTGLPLAKFVW
ncbi:hypothetical protein BJ546DRAFT_1073963 [Cryomyces antarcticus]